jgi:DNA (cytosine-5)-methyltransferase 1
MRQILSKIEDYPAHLRACWQEHLKPREPDAPTVISLFAGCGGSSLGYSMAGYRELLAVEWDDHAVETFKLNFPDVPVWHGDIAKLSVEECLRITGLKPGELDVLDGSPPCQGFSTAGKRKMDDGRNQLFREYVRLLRGLQPKVLVMENVSGMVKGKMKLIFADIMRELKASGYRVSARLMNAMYFGVPQSRERMIFIGVREDIWGCIRPED